MTTDPKKPDDEQKPPAEDTFRKFLEEVDLDDEEDEAMKQRILTLSGEGEALE